MAVKLVAQPKTEVMQFHGHAHTFLVTTNLFLKPILQSHHPPTCKHDVYQACTNMSVKI